MIPTHRTDGRAQTTLDFAIAMGVFLLTVTFVFTFIPSLTAPFVDGSQDQTAVSDRVASNLAEGALADPDDPYVLNVTCTTSFFSETDQPGCGYAATPSDYRNRTGVSDRPNVNVSIARIDAETRERTTLCDDGAGSVVNATDSECDPPGSGVIYRIGDDPTHAESITVSRRVVSVGGQDATLFVRVW